MKTVHVSVCTEPGYDNHSNNAMDNNLHLLDLRTQAHRLVFCLCFCYFTSQHHEMVDMGELLKSHLDQLQAYQSKYHCSMYLNFCMRLEMFFSFRQISDWGNAVDCRNVSELKVS